MSLAVAACGGDDDVTDDSAEPAVEEPAAEEPAAEEPAAEEPAAEEPAAEEPAAEEPAAEEPGAEEPMAEPEQPEVTVGLIPIADVAPVFVGINEGIFEAHGLTVSTEFAAGGAAAIPAVVSGDIDFAFGAYPSYFTAVEQGLPLLVSSEAVRAAPLFGGLYSLPDSGIASPADMSGATVAVNTLNNLVQIAVEYQLQQAGLALDDVTLVEIPFPDMVAALELGDVDVIAVVGPFGGIARNTLDATLVTDMFAGEIEGFPVAGFYVTEDFASQNPNTIAAFNAAFAEATELTNSDPDLLHATLLTYTSTPSVEAAAALNYPEFVSGLDTGVLDTVSQFMVDQGLLEEAISAADHSVG